VRLSDTDLAFLHRAVSWYIEPPQDGGPTRDEWARKQAPYDEEHRLGLAMIERIGEERQKLRGGAKRK
jgi:hypothetical protein